MYAQDNNSLPVWIILSPAHHHISINSQPFLVGIVSAPRRGATVAMTHPPTHPPPLESTENAQPVGPDQDHPLQLATDMDEDNQPATQHPVVPAAAIPLTQQEMPAAMTCQTRSGRVIKNTPDTIKAFRFATRGLWPGNSL